MAQDNSPHKTMATKCRRSRTKFTEEQLKILINAFNQKPYPGYAVKQRLALEVNTEESRIQIWFQNRRARHGFPKRPEKNLDSSQDPAYPEENIQGVRDRRCRTSYTSSQLQTLMNAFMENPYPGIDSREQLAEAIGVPESRVQVHVKGFDIGRFGFKTEDLDCVPRIKENTKKLQTKDKTRDKISEMGVFKV